MPAGSRIRIKISIKQEIGEEITFSYTAQHKPPENVGSRPGAELLGAIAAAPVAWPGQQPAGQSTDGMRYSRTATGERTPDPTSPSPAEPLAQSASAHDASRSGESKSRELCRVKMSRERELLEAENEYRERYMVDGLVCSDENQNLNAQTSLFLNLAYRNGACTYSSFL